MTEQEELELLKQNSPMALPDDPSASGWSTDQIKRKFYTGLLVLYDFFKASRNSQNGNIQSMQEIVDEINTAYNEIMNQETILKVKFDMDGNEIVTTYAKLLDIANGTVAAVKYLAEDGTTKKYIYELESALTTLTSNFNLVKEWADNIKSATSTEAVQRAVQATKDSLGNVIKDTYATVNSFTQISTNVANIINGTTIVDKTYKDQNGNVIDNTYETKANVDIIKSKIPNEASSENQLADKAFVNSSISTATATYRGSYNLVSDLSLTTSATESSIATALGTVILTADNNDYCYVRIPTATDNPTQISQVDRYKHNGTAWVYEYTLNNSGYTSTQWAAINSGITSALVAAIGLNTTARHTHDNKGLLDTYTQTEADIADAVGKKHTHSNKSVLDGITAQDISNIVKSLYNLGAFDTISGNTITRQTGYYTFTGNENWTSRGSGTACDYYYTDIENIKGLSNGFNENYILCNVALSGNSYDGNIPNLIGIDSNRIYISVAQGVSPKTIYNSNAYIQYQLATSYTESIIPNQPLLNLDQNGCNFLREEWEKGLNLFDTFQQSNFTNVNGTTTTAKNTSTQQGTITTSYNPDYENRAGYIFDVVVGQAYSFSCLSNSSTISIEDGNGSLYNQTTDNHNTTFVPTTNKIVIRFGTNFTSTPATITNLMLVEADHKYPYQEYNGAIVREKDIEPVLLWSNPNYVSSFNPDEGLDYKQITTLDRTPYKYIKVFVSLGAGNNIFQIITLENTANNYETQLFMIDDNAACWTRSFKFVDNTTIRIGKGKNGSSAVNNNRVVPKYIYGTNVL